MNIKKENDVYVVRQEMAGLILTFRNKNRLAAIKQASDFILGNLALKMGNRGAKYISKY